ncbi:hypothetical protein F4781DRAFT_20006 [Annulohypoxylon bovei var. microspora]|nr:hypothetical protein F4781DRAFT_20006 [Annulohypoxylon bovei var. microspora]
MHRVAILLCLFISPATKQSKASCSEPDLLLIGQTIRASINPTIVSYFLFPAERLKSAEHPPDRPCLRNTDHTGFGLADHTPGAVSQVFVYSHIYTHSTQASLGFFHLRDSTLS